VTGATDAMPITIASGSTGSDADRAHTA
jgi:hypothetical protein